MGAERRREIVMMGPGFGYYGGFGMGGGSFMMILVLLAIGLLVYFAFNRQQRESWNVSAAPNTNALELAKTRLARGEISLEEFEQIKNKLLEK